jgi:hypothetical protein
VLEINQACAVQTGCFSGDTPGLPVTIDGSAGQSYRLTSSLAVPDENTHGILVSASSITIDLGGFEISGPVVCTGSRSALVCAPSGGAGAGITTSRFDQNLDLTIRNGTVRGMGDVGVVPGLGGRVLDVSARSNGGAGFGLIQATASGCMAAQNGGRGFSISEGSVVGDSRAIGNRLEGFSSFGSVLRGVVARSNGSAGIAMTGSDNVVADSIVELNGGDGIGGGIAAVVRGASARNNDGRGIVVGDGGIVRDSTARQNDGDGIVVGQAGLVSDSASTENGGNGIVAAAAATVQRSTSRGNTGGEGLLLDATATYREVTTGTVSGGIDMGGNSCNGTASCP